jgi:acyl-CoA dehydrogenase
MGTQAREANGDRDKRWDTSRISAFSEILAFCGVDYCYAWQVTILGLEPIWQSENAWARRRGSVARRRCGVRLRAVGARTRGLT